MSTSSIKRQIRRFHVVVVLWTSKKCTKKSDHQTYWFFEVVVVVICLSSLIVSLNARGCTLITSRGGGGDGGFQESELYQNLTSPPK